MYRQGFFANKNGDNPLMDDTLITVLAPTIRPVSATASDANLIHTPSGSGQESVVAGWHDGSVSGSISSSGSIGNASFGMT